MPIARGKTEPNPPLTDERKAETVLHSYNSTHPQMYQRCHVVTLCYGLQVTTPYIIEFRKDKENEVKDGTLHCCRCRL